MESAITQKMQENVTHSLTKNHAGKNLSRKKVIKLVMENFKSYRNKNNKMGHTN